jgi:hypothetical protein
VLVPLLLLGAWPAAAAFDPTEWRFHSRVEVPYFPAEEIVAIELNADVYEYMRPDGADLRILDEMGREIPYLLQRLVRGRRRSVREPCPARLLNLEEKDNQLEITYELAAQAGVPDGLAIVTPLRDFERFVTVLGSTDGAAWRTLTHEAPIFDFSRFMDVARFDVPVPAGDCRHFRILIRDVTDAARSPWAQLTRELASDGSGRTVEALAVENRPLRIDRLEFWRNATREDAHADETSEYPVQSVAVLREGKLTHVDVTVRREPLTAFTLLTPSRNFSRRVTVSVREQEGLQTRWRQVGAGQWLKIDFRALQREELTVRFPEQRAEVYRLTVDDGDSPPLEVRGVRAEGNVYRATFLAFPGRTYDLYYGGADARAPAYDQVTVLNPLQDAYRAQPVLLGRRLLNERFAQRPAAADWFRRPWVLVAAAAVAVLVLGWGLYQASRRLDRAARHGDW